MWQHHFKRVAVALGLGIFLAAVLVAIAGAFAEEPIFFRDPYTKEVDLRTNVSTIHTDITYVLALAAGFSIDDSRTLMIWDQLVDSNQIQLNSGTSYSNCSGSFPKPEPVMKKVCDNQTEDHLMWPWWDKVPSSHPGACVTTRFGPYEGFFHAPHFYGKEIASLKEWGWGRAQELTGYRGYAWGPEMTRNFSQATCFYTETVTIDIGIEPGSLEAFATYLHSLADSYSHRDCVAAADALGWGWANHTPVFAEDAVYECNYTPVRVSNDDSHGREFGKAYPDDSQRTDEAIRAVYEELVARARDKHEGVYQPLSLDTRLKGKLHSITLDKALYYYVHKWNFDQPFERRKYADLLAEAILAQRVPIDR